jgi:methylenetetrahydrofolate reductase (NADPH)
LALRGDPVGGPRAPWTPVAGGLTHADELITLAREHGAFTIGVAAFPDGHPNSEGDFSKDIDVLLRKESLGASFATTQFFFEVEKWKRLVDALAKRGSTMPIIAGVLPVTNVKLLTKMAELGGTPIPDSIAARFAAVEDNPEDVRKLGVEIALNLCNDLIDAGVPGIHFYTMNSSTATSEIFESLQDRR